MSNRHLAHAALAIAVLAAAGEVPRGAAAQAGPNAPCFQALAYEKSATSDANSAQARLTAVNAGLAANQRCPDPQMKLVNEAYLLSMRAPAEHDLKVGDWRRDMERANMLLTQCANWPGLRGTQAGKDCTTQISYNGLIAKNLSAQPTPAPSGAPAPSASAAPGASPVPAASGAPAPRLGPAMPPPAPPRPSISPSPAR